MSINNCKKSFFIIASFAFLGLGVSFLNSEATFADEENSDVFLSVPVSCNITGELDSPHIATITNGNYSSEIGTTTLTVFCNDNDGFAIYAAGYTGNVIGGTNSNKLVGVNNSNLTINTGTYTQGTTVDSVWAMKLNKVTNTSGQDDIVYNPDNLTILSDANGSFGSYHVVPLSYTKVASFSSSTDNTLGSKIETTYAAYVSETQASDTYRGKVKYTLVHPSTNVPNEPHICTSGNICYWPNAEGEVADSMGDETLSATTTLWPSNYNRNGYSFVGWSDAFDWVANVGSKTNPDAHIYGPNETITVDTNDYPNGLSLYAVWVLSAGAIQGWTGCSNLSIGQVTALTDLRDNDTYAVAKLADGKCWMIENLRIDNTATTGEANKALAQGYGSRSGSGTNYGEFIGLAEPEGTTQFTWGDPTAANDSTNSLYSSDGSTTIDIGSSDYPAYRIPRYNNINTASPASNMTAFNNNTNVYSLGNYYNWPAAVANTNVFNTDNTSVTTTSICPAGWHIPTGGSVTSTHNVTNDSSTWSEYYNLGYSVMGSVANDSNAGTDGGAYYTNSTTNTAGDTGTKAFRKYPYNYVYAGRIKANDEEDTNSGLIGRGTAGFYWPSTVNNNRSKAYRFYIGSSFLTPATIVQFKYNGFAVRCLINS